MDHAAQDLNTSAATHTLGVGPQTYQIRVEFTGSGSEYFRIWIVNILLMLLTLGIYYPWAKVRRLRYFHNNTLVDSEPLGFHGDPKKMLKGYLLVGLLFVLYSIAGNFSAMAGFVAFLMVAAVWPALLKSSMQFRLANTSWRGLRFRFMGSLGGAYRAMLPLFLPGTVLLGAVTGVADPEKPPIWYLATIGCVMLVTLAVMPWLLWNLKQYQHNHYALANLQTTFKATIGAFYKMFFKAASITLLVVALPFGLITAATFVLKSGGGVTNARFLMMVLGMLLLFASALVMLAVIKPYLITRLQNLVWSRTGNASLRFLSSLRFRSLLWLSLKNWLFVILTLGLYWPFAAIATARLRLEAIEIKTRVSPETLVSQMQSAEGDAAGEAAGDLFGLDIGF